MKYDYHTDAAVGACPGCGKALVLYNHVQLLPGEAKHKLQVLDTIFCLECVEDMEDRRASASGIGADDLHNRFGDE